MLIHTKQQREWQHITEQLWNVFESAPWSGKRVVVEYTCNRKETGSCLVMWLNVSLHAPQNVQIMFFIFPLHYFVFQIQVSVACANHAISSALSSWPLEGACVPDSAVCRKYESRVRNLLAHFLISCNNELHILSSCDLLPRRAGSDDPLRARWGNFSVENARRLG